MITLHLVLMLFAIVCFFLAACNVPSPPRVNLVAAGLCLWALSTIVSV